MYFADRRSAGEKLALELTAYKNQPTTILVLSSGAALVAEPIAATLRCRMQLLLTEPIELKDLGGEAVGVIDAAGNFTLDQSIPAGLLEEYLAEDRVVIEEAKLQKLRQMTQPPQTKQAFTGKNIIMVSDGLKTGLSLDAAATFLKPIKIQRLIGVTPLASVPSVDRLHILCDEIHVLSVVAEYFDTNHYYDNNELDDPKVIIDRANKAATI